MNAPLRIYGNLSLLEMAPVLLAADRFYDGETIIEHGSVMALWDDSSDLASLASTGQADIALNTETQALRASAAHPDLRFIYTVAECPYRIVARRSAGISALSDLQGMRIGTQLESSAEYFLDAMMRTAGLSVEDANLVPFMARTASPLSALPEALQDGKIDAIAMWEPQVERAYRLIGNDAIEFYDPDVYTEKFSLCTTQANLDDGDMRRRIVVFVRALIAAARYLRNEPAVGWRLVEKTASLDADTVRNAWPCYTYPQSLAADMPAILQRIEPWLAHLQNRTPRSHDVLSGLLDDSVVREARE